MTAVNATNHMAMPAQGPAVEMLVAKDIAKKGVMIAPVFLLLGFIAAGFPGLASVGFGLAVVVLNFLLSAWLLDVAAKISLAFVMAAALFGFLLRLGLITAAVLLVKDQSWVRLIPLCITLIVTHLGLLFWELRHVSATLAFPGLKPQPTVKD